MATRNPLIYSGNNLVEMTSGQMDALILNIVYQYSQSPSVALSVVGSSGTLGSLSDTRLQAGAISNSNSSFPSQGTTQDPQTVTVSYDKITQTVQSVTKTTDTGTTWPIYYETSGGNLRAMPIADIKDTFLHPAIDLLTASTTTSQQGGTYHISTSSSVSGSTEVSGSNTPIFIDTRANTGSYASGSIGDHAQDNPTTITSYYLQRVNGATSSYEQPLTIVSGNNLQQVTTSNFNTLLQGWIRETAANSSDGYSIRYNFNGSGTTRGSGMANTVLNGTNYQTRQVGDDYRAQEFPAGSATTQATHTLKILKA